MAPKSDKAAAVRRRFLETLGVDFDVPFFKVTDMLATRVRGGCDHLDRGVRLDMGTRTATCVCGTRIDLFDALLIYANAEQRLVRSVAAVKHAAQAEVDRKAREQARRPFLRKVVSRRERKDLSLKAEPTVGYDVTLECGHTSQHGPGRRLKNMTCGTCAQAATK